MRSWFYELFIENMSHLFSSSHCIRGGEADMKKIYYSQDVDAVLVELFNEATAYAEADGQVILHYSDHEKLVLIEILDFKKFISEDTAAKLALT